MKQRTSQSDKHNASSEHPAEADTKANCKAKQKWGEHGNASLKGCHVLILTAYVLLSSPLYAVTFESWIAGYGLSGADALADADPDNDRLTNLVEYALYGLNPTTPDSSAVTSYGFAPAAQDGSYGDAEQQPPVSAPLSWHHAMVYRLRANIEDVSVYPQISHDCPATNSGGTMAYWLGSGGRDDALTMVYSRADGKLQAMSRMRGHLQKRAFMRLEILRDGGTRMPSIEGTVTPFLGLITGPVQYVPRTVGSTTTTNPTTQDVTYQQVVKPQIVRDIKWPWTLGSSGLSSGDVTRSFSPSGIVTLSGTDVWQYVSSGVVTITLTTPTKSYSHTLSTFATGEETTRTYTSSVSGSLRAHLVAQTDTRASAFSGIAERHVMLSEWNPGVSYVRSTNCWITGGTDLDMTPVAVWNSETAAYGNSWRGQTLVSPRHYIGAAHWAVAVGTTLHFVTADNTLVSRTVTGRQIISGTDIIVGVLDSDVPGTIGFARVLPDAWAAKLPTLSLIPYPVCSMDQGRRIFIRDLAALDSNGRNGVRCQVPTLAARLPFYAPAVSGDSGSPVFLIINNAMVLLGTWYGGGGGSAPFVTAHRAAINAAMTTLGGGYQLTDADLSGFTSY